MKLRLCVLLFLLVPSIAFAAPNIPDHPAGAGLVNDFAGMLTEAERAELESKLRAHETKTQNEIAVVTVKSLEGYSIEEYSIALTRKWGGIGKKGADNGVLFLIAPNEREVRIEVGRRLEAHLTDAYTKVIIESVFIPRMRAGDRAGAIMGGAEAIIAALEAVPAEEQKQMLDHRKGKASGVPMIFFLVGIVILVGIMVLMVIVTSRSRPVQEPGRDTDDEPEKPVRKRTNKAAAIGAAIGAASSSSRPRKRSSSSDDDDSPSSSSSSPSYKPPSSSSSGFKFGGGSFGGGGSSGKW